MTYQKKDRASLIVNKIEEQKEGRYKNIYLFTLSVTPEEEKEFNRKLKDIINEISQN
jgi:oligoribonuclease NrnB/cAMP/cGMP phosphodiesterase (DHH superfamily)